MASRFWRAFLIGISFTLVPRVTLGALECTVGGHGPYPEKKAACQTLAEDQAQTNCRLSDANAQVEFVWRASPKSAYVKGVCVSKYEIAVRDCHPAKCQVKTVRNIHPLRSK